MEQMRNAHKFLVGKPKVTSGCLYKDIHKWTIEYKDVNLFNLAQDTDQCGRL